MLVLRIAFKFLVTLFAIILIIVGAIMTPTPVPFGIIFVIIGFFLLAAGLSGPHALVAATLGVAGQTAY